MQRIEFLTLAKVFEIHQDQIVRYNGQPGTRDLDLLESARPMPSASLGGLHTHIFEMAAAHLFHLIQCHPFIATSAWARSWRLSFSL